MPNWAKSPSRSVLSTPTFSGSLQFRTWIFLFPMWRWVDWTGECLHADQACMLMSQAQAALAVLENLKERESQTFCLVQLFLYRWQLPAKPFRCPRAVWLVPYTMLNMSHGGPELTSIEIFGGQLGGTKFRGYNSSPISDHGSPVQLPSWRCSWVYWAIKWNRCGKTCITPVPCTRLSFLCFQQCAVIIHRIVNECCSQSLLSWNLPPSLLTLQWSVSQKVTLWIFVCFPSLQKQFGLWGLFWTEQPFSTFASHNTLSSVVFSLVFVSCEVTSDFQETLLGFAALYLG